ncbi:hypothetical protein R70199_07566 [Paraburkholderia domus]|nr:hypothetical protein R70199_07566 [Paraburkholderia domus]
MFVKKRRRHVARRCSSELCSDVCALPFDADFSSVASNWKKGVVENDVQDCYLDNPYA